MAKFVTIGRFENIISANLAKQDLEAEGIKTFLADEMTIAIVWYWTIAVGWLKLQVPASEVERAIDVLDEARSDVINSEENLSSSNESAQSLLDHEDNDVVRLSRAERTVERMFRTAVLGIFFLPLQLYSLWLLVRLLVSLQKVSHNHYWKVIITIIFNAPTIAILGAIFL